MPGDFEGDAEDAEEEVVETPEGWKNLSAKQYSVLVPVEKKMAKETVFALDLMKEMAEALEDAIYYLDPELGPDSPKKALKKFKEWK